MSMLNFEQVQYFFDLAMLVDVSRRARNKEEKLARIVAAARLLFAEQGFERTTTRQIAERADIGAGTLFVYFPTKIDLLLHLLLSDLAEVEETAYETLDPELPLVDAVMHIFSAFHDLYARDMRLARVLIKETLFLESEQRLKHTAFSVTVMQRLAMLVTRAKERDELPAHVPEAEAAYHFFAAYTLGVMSWLGGVMPREAQSWMLRRALSLLIAGYEHESLRGGP